MNKKTKEPAYKTNGHNSRLVESCLFLLVILLEAGIFLYMIHERRIVGGHDGFQYFSVQYSFLNHVVNYGEIPQWSPFMTHGSLAALGYLAPEGILQNVLLLSGGLFKDINFLPLFYAGIFLDELLLLAGVWLLARRFFASPLTVFFVTLSIMGSCIWVLQPWFNFHFYYALPLILYFIHLFLDSGKWRYYFLAGNLLFIQCLGNLPYFLPVTSLVIFLYFLFYFVFNHQDTWQKIKNIKFGWFFVLSTFVIILSFTALYIAMNSGVNQIVNYNVLRNLDWSTNLNPFLIYGGILNWKIWLELILGMSPFLDYTLYIGILCVPFILLGLIFNSNKQNLHFLLTIMVLLLFSMGTFVSIFFYYSWPMMKFFRHLALVSPIIKVFLCFLAGFGFDAVFFNKSRFKNPAILKVSLAVMAVLMMSISVFLWLMSHDFGYCINLLKSMEPEGNNALPFFTTIFNENVIGSLLNRTLLFALTAAFVLAALSFINRRKYFYLLAIFLLAVHCTDMYGFKISEIKMKSAPLTDELYKITALQPMPYPQRRDISFWNNNHRAELLKVLPIQYGAFYWTTNAFLFKDEWGSQFRNDFCLLPLYKYMKAYWQKSSHDSLVKSSIKGHPAAFKISGVTEDKIQFFSGADIIASEDTIASLITDSRYKGDTIFLSLPGNNKKTGPIDAFAFPETKLSVNQRIFLPYRVTRFDSNNIEINTRNNSQKSVWLLYSDVWHPLWKGTVNGKDAAVYKANLAYKAVKLEPGSNTVHFHFVSRLMSAIFIVFGLNALGWLGIILYLNGKIVWDTSQRW